MYIHICIIHVYYTYGLYIWIIHMYCTYVLYICIIHMYYACVCVCVYVSMLWSNNCQIRIPIFRCVLCSFKLLGLSGSVPKRGIFPRVGSQPVFSIVQCTAGALPMHLSKWCTANAPLQVGTFTVLMFRKWLPALSSFLCFLSLLSFMIVYCSLVFIKVYYMLFYLIIVSCIFVFKGPISFNFPGMFHLDLNCVPSALRAPVGAFGSSERSAASQEKARRLGGRQMGTKSKEFPKSKCLCRFFFLVTRFFPKLQPTILRMLWSCLFIPFLIFT